MTFTEEPEVKCRIIDRYALVSYQMLAFMGKNKEYTDVITYIIRHMDKGNILEGTQRKIANTIKAKESNISLKLKTLERAGAIIRQKKRIMLNPLCAIKCNRAWQNILLKIWNSGDISAENFNRVTFEAKNQITP